MHTYTIRVFGKSVLKLRVSTEYERAEWCSRKQQCIYLHTPFPMEMRRLMVLFEAGNSNSNSNPDSAPTRPGLCLGTPTGNRSCGVPSGFCPCRGVVPGGQAGQPEGGAGLSTETVLQARPCPRACQGDCDCAPRAPPRTCCCETAHMCGRHIESSGIVHCNPLPPILPSFPVLARARPWWQGRSNMGVDSAACAKVHPECVSTHAAPFPILRAAAAVERRQREGRGAGGLE